MSKEKEPQARLIKKVPSKNLKEKRAEKIAKRKERRKVSEL